MGRPPRRLVETIDLITGRVPLPESLGPAHRALFEKLRELVLSEHVEGVAIARKESGGKLTEERGIVFYVSEKLPGSRLAAEAAVPPVILDASGKAILTDVRVVGKVTAQLNIAAAPIRSGFSISHRNGRPGTLGAVVRYQGRRHLLSAKHVFTNNGQGSEGDAIYFPALADGGQRPDSHVANLLDFDPYILGPGYPNATDAALAEVLEAKLQDLDPAIPGATAPLRAVDPLEGMHVQLIGRSSSGGTRSTVKGLAATPRPFFEGVGKVGFFGQVECSVYTQGGDSGSLVVNDAGAVVGLHIAGSDESSFFTPIKRVIEALSFSF